VHIRYAAVPARLEFPRSTGVLFQAERGRYLLSAAGVARYEVRGGSQIFVDRAPNGEDRSVRRFLLSSAICALLHQRGLLPLHAAALATPRGAVLLAGHSGAGKSTLLAEFVRRGFSMLADDITPVAMDGAGQAMATAAVPSIRLWADAANHLGHDVATLSRFHPDAEKYIVPALARFVAAPQPVAAIYVLQRDSDATIRLDPCHGGARAFVLREHTFGRRLVVGLDLESHHFQLSNAVATSTRIVTATRPRHPFLLKALADRIEQDFT
jgi:hypothetical protein